MAIPTILQPCHGPKEMKEFNSIGAFAEHILKTAIAEEVAIRVGLSKSIEAVKKEAKSEFGTYQEAAGPFAAWADLAESTKEDRVRKGYSEDEPLLRTGEIRDSIETTVSSTSLEAQCGSDSDILLYQELGTQHTPPRSTLGIAMAKKLPMIKEILGASVVTGLVGEDVFQRFLPIEE